MTYSELKDEIASRSISQLPALVGYITELCASRTVFTNKTAMLRFVDRYWDEGERAERVKRAMAAAEEKGPTP